MTAAKRFGSAPKMCEHINTPAFPTPAREIVLTSNANAHDENRARKSEAGSMI
jgi:hypothetical protein